MGKIQCDHAPARRTCVSTQSDLDETLAPVVCFPEHVQDPHAVTLRVLDHVARRPNPTNSSAPNSAWPRHQRRGRTFREPWARTFREPPTVI